MGAYLGKDFSPGDSSTRVQEAAKATSYFQGDATAFLLGKLAKGQPETYITEMKPALQQGIAGPNLQCSRRHQGRAWCHIRHSLA